jgi:ribonuclease T1
MPPSLSTQKFRFVLILLVLLAAGWWLNQPQPDAVKDRPASTTRAELPAPQPPPEPISQGPATLPAFLPPEAHATLALIASDGPFPYRQDGNVFQNREQRLPRQARGYYREYTVRTPGERDRGARRIVTGGNPPREFWYTEDHYRSFRRFAPARFEVAQ